MRKPSSRFLRLVFADGAGDDDGALVFRDAQDVFAMTAFEVDVGFSVPLLALAELARAAKAFGLFHIPIALAAALHNLFRKGAVKDVDHQKHARDVQKEEEGEGQD